MNSLSASEAIPRMEVWNCNYLDGEDRPVGTYKFRYRSLGECEIFCFWKGP